MNEATLAIDIGGTKVRVGLVDATHTIIRTSVFATPAGGEPAELSESLKDACRRLAAGIKLSGTAGVALPGVWDRQTFTMQTALNLPKLEGCDIRKLFESAVGCRIVLETDVNAAAWGQYRAWTLATGGPPARFAYLSIGTGVGGAVILDGAPVRHTRGGPGHFGHWIADTAPDAPLCKCGMRGCLEACVSGGSASPQPRRDSDAPPARAARALATGLHQIMVAYAPELILLAGGVIEGNPALLHEAKQALAGRRCSLWPPAMRIERAPKPADEAAILGIAALAHAAAHNPV